MLAAFAPKHHRPPPRWRARDLFKVIERAPSAHVIAVSIESPEDHSKARVTAFLVWLTVSHTAHPFAASLLPGTHRGAIEARCYFLRTPVCTVLRREKMRRLSTLQTTNDNGTHRARWISTERPEPRGPFFSAGTTRVWIRDAAAPTVFALHTDSVGTRNARLGCPRTERQRCLVPVATGTRHRGGAGSSMRASTRAPPAVQCLRIANRGAHCFASRGDARLLPRTRIADSRYF